MAASVKVESINQVGSFVAASEVSETTRFGQYSVLSEMPGLIFGLLTIAWMVSSLYALV